MAVNSKNKNNLCIERADVLPFGAFNRGGDLVISLATEEVIKYICLLNKKTKDVVAKFDMKEEYKTANIYSFRVKGGAAYDYRLVGEDKEIKDTYAGVVCGEGDFGNKKNIRYAVIENDYDWEGDKRPDYSYEDSFIYRLHVRGFTKHTSSKVKNKGTFAGLVEKIDYLKKLKVTAVELMPAYEFDENIADGSDSGKINFWGYGNAHYFAPKEAYSSKKNGGQVKEFKDMVKALHLAGIEVIMDFYFVPGTNPYLIIDCLRYWVLKYHIDGIHVNMEVAPVEMIKEDPVLASVKIFADMWDVVDKFTKKGTVDAKHIAIFNDDFMINTRRFVKSDEGQTYGLMEKLKRNPEGCGVINYIANHYTFTLMDSVSYDRKHNEVNGEDNRDGTDYNYSWNCGLEGTTRKQKIKNLRIKQMKNSLTILFMSQGTPMLFAGDEMGRSRKGNNNPYCQDNDMTWINWNLLDTNREIYEYVQRLVDFRYSHRILHTKKEPKNIDYLSVGVPDISFHGVEPWRTDYSYGSRQLAVLYSGAYADDDNKNSVYVAFNAYWEDVLFNIPAADTKCGWKIVFATDMDICEKNKDNAKDDIVERNIVVPARSIIVLETDDAE